MDDKFLDPSLLDLMRATEFIHHIKPAFRDKVVYAIEKLKPFDQNIVFHLADRHNSNDANTDFTFMLSAEYLLEHPYWDGLKND